MTRERETGPLSAAAFRCEVQILAGDLQTVSNILIQISHADIELQHGWMSFFGRAIEGIAEQLEELSRRSA